MKVSAEQQIAEAVELYADFRCDEWHEVAR